MHKRIKRFRFFIYLFLLLIVRLMGKRMLGQITLTELSVMITLVADGVMCLDIMQIVQITRERLFAQLRTENLNDLGMVKRFYMEANGSFSLVANEKAQPGLLVLPDWDEVFISQKLNPSDVVICKKCGAKKPGNT